MCVAERHDVRRARAEAGQLMRSRGVVTGLYFAEDAGLSVQLAVVHAPCRASVGVYGAARRLQAGKKAATLLARAERGCGRACVVALRLAAGSLSSTLQHHPACSALFASLATLRGAQRLHLR